MKTEIAYFKAGAETSAIIDAFFAERMKNCEARDAFKARFNADDFYERGGSACGLGWKDATKVPLGWYRRKGEPFHVPPKGKDGKAIREELFRLNQLTASDLSDRLGFAGLMTPNDRGFGFVISYASAEKIGEQWIIGIPTSDKPCEWTCNDCEPLKTSEYWVLKESQSAQP